MSGSDRENIIRQATYVQCDIVVRSRNQCCRGKEISIKHYELVTVDLVIQHARCMRRKILSSVAC